MTIWFILTSTCFAWYSLVLVGTQLIDTDEHGLDFVVITVFLLVQVFCFYYASLYIKKIKFRIYILMCLILQKNNFAYCIELVEYFFMPIYVFICLSNDVSDRFIYLISLHRLNTIKRYLWGFFF